MLTTRYELPDIGASATPSLTKGCTVQSESIDIKELISILRRQGRLIALTIAVVLLPTVAYLMFATPMYRSTALIAIDPGGSNLLDPRGGEGGQSAVLNSRVDGEVEVLRADSTVMAVVQSGDLVRDPEFGVRLSLRDKVMIALGLEGITDRIKQSVGLRTTPTPQDQVLLKSTIDRLRAAVDVRRRGLTYLISVGVLSEDPQRAAELANLYVETYIARQVLNKTESVSTARDVLQSQAETARKNLTQIEDSLNSFIDDNLARLEQESTDPAIALLRRELETAQATKTNNLATLAATREAVAREDWLTVASTLENEAIAQLSRERDALINRLSGEVAGTQRDIELRQSLAAIDQTLTATLTEAQSGVENRLSSITQNETVAREQLRDALLSSDISSTVVTDLFNLQQNASIAREQYQRLLSRIQDLNALANVQIADARVVSEALPPRAATSPNKRLILTLALVVALGLGIGIALLNEYYVGGVTSLAQLANLRTARPVGAVPDTADTPGQPSAVEQVVSSPLSRYSESFRKLRLAVDTAIMQSLPDRSPTDIGKSNASVILMCSSVPGEGKSTSAISLARTYALSGKRTILLDCDLRKPSIAKYLRLDETSGLMDYLASDDPNVQLTTIVDVVNQLVIVPAGSKNGKPTDQIVNSERFAWLMGVIRSEFDVIVIDSPPILPVVDARYLARFADVAVMMVKFASTTQSEFRESSAQMLEALPSGVQLLGVLNRESLTKNRKGYYGKGYAEYYGA
jgi:polysaccharide biosynthesis transport protein